MSWWLVIILEKVLLLPCFSKTQYIYKNKNALFSMQTRLEPRLVGKVVNKVWMLKFSRCFKETNNYQSKAGEGEWARRIIQPHQRGLQLTEVVTNKQQLLK